MAADRSLLVRARVFKRICTLVADPQLHITVSTLSQASIRIVAGITVEMHGSVRQLVCPECGHVVKLSPPMARTLKAKKPLPCAACGHAPIRMRLMLYDDAEGELCRPLLNSISELSIAACLGLELGATGTQQLLPCATCCSEH